MGRTARTLLAVILVPVLAVSQEAKQEEAEPPAESTTTLSIEDFFGPPEEPSPEAMYQQSIVAAARLCQRSGRSGADCWEDASPVKCEALVYSALVGKGSKLKSG